MVLVQNFLIARWQRWWMENICLAHDHPRTTRSTEMICIVKKKRVETKQPPQASRDGVLHRPISAISRDGVSRSQSVSYGKSFWSISDKFCIKFPREMCLDGNGGGSVHFSSGQCETFYAVCIQIKEKPLRTKLEIAVGGLSLSLLFCLGDAFFKLSHQQ